jgi:HlyD family secretion protein
MKSSYFALAMAAMSLSGCNQTPKDTYAGYVEAQSLSINAPQSGWLTEVLIDRGAQVATGQPLFVLDDTQAAAQLQGAEARKVASDAQAADLSKGAREADIAPLLAQAQQARASLDLARSNQARYEALFAKGYASEAQIDSYRQATRSAEAGLKSVEKTIEEKRLAARTDQLAAAKAAAEASKADVAASQWVVDERAVKSRTSGRVDERLREPGEYVAAGTPVLTLLPKGREFVRFYVPQSELARFKIGQSLKVSCDGCKAQTAKVRFIAHEAEFTPPVIYSLKERQKLVFLIEAVPERPDDLHAGQPVDVGL